LFAIIGLGGDEHALNLKQDFADAAAHLRNIIGNHHEKDNWYGGLFEGACI
jgi:hypothetical protein